MPDENLEVPEFSIAPYPITCRFLSKEELPEDIDDFGDYKGIFSKLNKVNKGKLPENIYDSYTFIQYMHQMYQKAREKGTVACFTYDGEDHVDFPVENPDEKIRLYASFIPSNTNKGRWFCIGIRQGGKIHDFAKLADINDDYKHLKIKSNISEKGINSGFLLRDYIEDAFVDSIINSKVFQYTIGEETFVEYPLNILTSDMPQQYTIRFKCSQRYKQWRFSGFRIHGIKSGLEINIKKDAFREWRRYQRRELADSKEKEELIEKEKEYYRKEAEKQLIDFLEFLPRKTEACFENRYSYSLKTFAYINMDPILYLPDKSIDLRDSDIVMDAIEKAFSCCNAYQDIDYYHYSSGDTAELRITVPGYEKIPLYAVFDKNTRSGCQPWHLKSTLQYQDIYHRYLFVQDYEKTLQNLKSICPECMITSTDGLKKFMNSRFTDAISGGEIYYYGNPKNHRLELPMMMHSQGAAVHAIFAESGKDVPWTLKGFRLRRGEDVRFCISDEYEQECAEAEKQKESSRDNNLPADSKEPVQQTRTSKETSPEFIGTTVRDKDGNPIDLVNFSKSIKPSMLHHLAIMAEEEQWGFSQEEPFSILIQYLNERFIRLGYEGKIGISHGKNGDEYAVFHTGLFTYLYHEPIYACFRPQPHDSLYYNGPKWRLDGFCCEMEGGPVHDRMVKYIHGLPTDVNFMKQNGEYLPSWKCMMDVHLPIDLKEEHILNERGYRLPAEFLHKVFDLANDVKALEHLQKLEEIILESDKKDYWNNELSPYLDSKLDTYNILIQHLGYVVQEARDCNVRQAIPAYYPRDNEIRWLLPLRFYHDVGNLKNLVLIVGTKESGGYKGITIMNIEDVYHHARTINNPDCSWVRKEILDTHPVSYENLDLEEENDEHDNCDGEE